MGFSTWISPWTRRAPYIRAPFSLSVRQRWGSPLPELAADGNLSTRLQQQIGRKKDSKAIPVLDRVTATAPRARIADQSGWRPWFRGIQAKQTPVEILALTPGAKGRMAHGLR
jgi:hypothetical protein